MNINLINILYVVHVSCVCLSISGFIIRGWLFIQNNPLLQQRWLKITPHIIDTILLASAVGLAIQLNLSPLQHTWLSAKIIALLFYIGIGIVTFRFARTTVAKVGGVFLALCCVLYIVLAALSKSALLNLF